MDADGVFRVLDVNKETRNVVLQIGSMLSSDI